MKRFLLLSVVLTLIAGQANAAMYYMDQTTAAGMTLLGTSAGDTSSLLYVGYKPGGLADRVAGSDPAYGDIMNLAVGFSGRLADFSGGDSAIATIGLSKPALTGTFGGFVLPISNDDNQIWRYQSYVTVGATTYTSGWAQLTHEAQSALLANIGSDTDFANVTGIGFMIEWKPSVNGYSASDDYHASVVPVPAAVIMGLLGLGVAGLKLRRFA